FSGAPLKKLWLFWVISASGVVLVLAGYDFLTGHKMSQYLAEAFQAQETVYRLENIRVEEGCVNIRFDGEELYFSLDGDGNVILEDSGGKRLEEKEPSEDGIYPGDGTPDPLHFRAEIQNAIPYLVAEYREIAWYFTDRTEDGGYTYITPYGKADSITEAKSIFSGQWDSLLTYRGYIWGRTVPLLGKSIVWGSGPNTFALVFPQNDYLTRAKLKEGFFREILIKPHNMYLQAALETGVASLLLLLAFWGRYLIESFRLYRKKEGRDGVGLIGLAIFAGIAGYLLAGITNDSIVAAALLPPTAPKPYVEAAAKRTTLSNPVIVKDSSMRAGQTVIWDCVWFGSYPQAEVIPSETYTALDSRLYQQGEDVIVSPKEYAALQSAAEDDWDNNDITLTINKKTWKYRRMKKKDATSVMSGENNYQWSDDTAYHYFKYEPIKWRVLHTDGKQALLLSDVVLDDQKYHTKKKSVTWETSTVRSWLNGYGAESNEQSVDYTQKNFIGSAFTPEEQAAIANSPLENGDSTEYGTEGGNGIADKVFLLSKPDVWNTDKAESYGFVKDGHIRDEARRCKSSTWAKAMGVYSDTRTDFIGNGWWWLRSSDSHENIATMEVNYDGQVYEYSNYVSDGNYGVRPALKLKLGYFRRYSYAGKNYSKEKQVGKIEGNMDGTGVHAVTVDPEKKTWYTFSPQKTGFYLIEYADNNASCAVEVYQNEWLFASSREAGHWKPYELENGHKYYLGIDAVIGNGNKRTVNISKANRYEYYEYEECQAFLASGGTINYVPDKTEKRQAFLATGGTITYEPGEIGKGGSWEFNTDGFKNQKVKWTPVKRQCYASEDASYQSVYDTFEKKGRPLEKLYIAKPENFFFPVAAADLATGGNTLIVVKYKQASESPNPPEQQKPDKEPPEDYDEDSEIPDEADSSDIQVNYSKIKMRKGTKFRWLEVSVLPENASDKTLSWESSNPKVASVNGKGVIKAKKTGKARITVATANGIKKHISVQVVNKKITVTKIKLSRKKATLKKGKKLKLSPTVTPVNAENKKLTWESSNSKVASVNSKGVVTAKKPGKAKITCRAKDGSRKKAVCVITVKREFLDFIQW
ncbi:MAG: Ig-like domain-containing protein, partial [Lachnospiraceae bacterium]|nr:Ig-like domain-containing protein [Lachnospiraceae bacterium]